MIQPRTFTSVLFAAGLILATGALDGAAQKPAEQKAALSSGNTTPAAPPSVAVVPVVSQELKKTMKLPGELVAFQDVALYPKTQGFVEWIGVDRGSMVEAGQQLVRLSAPELSAQKSEAQAKALAAQSQRLEAESKVLSIKAQLLEAAAKLASDEATYRRLQSASATPGAVAGNEVETSQRTVEADRARVKLYEENVKGAQALAAAFAENENAAREGAKSVEEVASYLNMTAPFDGVITERNAHLGSLVGPSGGPASSPVLRIRQVSQLRLVVAVPEANVASVTTGVKANFTVPAFPAETFTGTVQRIAHALEMKTRTMPVELDVPNSEGRLAPGMYADVKWTMTRPHPSLFVPLTAVVVTTDRTFVVRIVEGVTEWVDVRKGIPMGDLIEGFGDLHSGDLVAVRGTDELRAGTTVIPKEAPKEKP